MSKPWSPELKAAMQARNIGYGGCGHEPCAVCSSCLKLCEQDVVISTLRAEVARLTEELARVERFHAAAEADHEQAEKRADAAEAEVTRLKAQLATVAARQREACASHVNPFNSLGERAAFEAEVRATPLVTEGE